MCKSCSCKKRKIYYQNNKTKIIKQTSNYTNNRTKIDPVFKLERRIRSRIYVAFKKQSLNKKERTWKYIGCTPTFLKKWIKFQLYDGMTLENYGKYWHIDHVIPCCKYDLSKKDNVEQCFNWRNLRPYKAKKNLSKRDKISKSDIIFQELKVKYFIKNYYNIIPKNETIFTNNMFNYAIILYINNQKSLNIHKNNINEKDIINCSEKILNNQELSIENSGPTKEEVEKAIINLTIKKKPKKNVIPKTVENLQIINQNISNSLSNYYHTEEGIENKKQAHLKRSETMAKKRAEIQSNMTHKLCKRCNIEKSIDNFNKKSAAKDGLQTNCKSCVNIAKQEWRLSQKN